MIQICPRWRWAWGVRGSEDQEHVVPGPRDLPALHSALNTWRDLPSCATAAYLTQTPILFNIIMLKKTLRTLLHQDPAGRLMPTSLYYIRSSMSNDEPF